MNDDFFSNTQSDAENLPVGNTQFSGLGNEPPPDDFVLCRDAEGNPTAVYGEDKWNLNPYRLKANRISLIRFDLLFSGTGCDERNLIRQVKYLLFCLMYYVGSGHVGRLSAGVIGQYMLVLRSLARFCLAQRQNELVGVLSFHDLFTTPVYIAAFLRENQNLGGTQRTLLRSLINHMVSVGEERLGYRVQGVFDLEFGSSEPAKQHPVIPTRIYLELINRMGDYVDQINEGIGSFETFLASFSDPGYGTTYKHQTMVLRTPYEHVHPELADAIRNHGLEAVFSGQFACIRRNTLSSSILKMQWVVKNVIHAYTGMRDQEVLRLPYDCISDEEVQAATVDDLGTIRDKARMVSIISTTTKFTGYRKSEAWLATDEVIRAVRVGQAICRGIARLYGTDPTKMPLFLNPAVVSYPNTPVGVSQWNQVSKTEGLRTGIFIQPADLEELRATDSGRDFSSEEKFQIGAAWPLSSHQFRRSLAFYASSSGFVSLPSLKKQFKHLTSLMTRYYANNFQNLKTIFGFYDPKKKAFVIPKSHIAFEFQMGMPMSVAYNLVAELLGAENPLFGGVGGYADKQRKRLNTGEVSIAEVREETTRQAENGHIWYRPTLLGGCTKAGQCDEYLLGDYTACLACEGAIIKPEKVAEAVEEAEDELSRYKPGTGEYQVVQSELTRLQKFSQRFIPVVEVQ